MFHVSCLIDVQLTARYIALMHPIRSFATYPALVARFSWSGYPQLPNSPLVATEPDLALARIGS